MDLGTLTSESSECSTSTLEKIPTLTGSQADELIVTKSGGKIVVYPKNTETAKTFSFGVVAKESGE